MIQAETFDAGPDASPRGSLASAVAQVAAGRSVVVSGGADDDSYLVFAADRATVDLMAFAVRHTSGFICVALPPSVCDRLRLPPMWPVNGLRSSGPYTVTVDASEGVTTGISAADRCATVRRLADPRATASDFDRPGHVMVATLGWGSPHVLAALNLMGRAGRSPAAVFAAIVSSVEPTGMAREGELDSFAKRHSLELVAVGDLIRGGF